MDADGQGSVSFLIQGSSKSIHLTAGRVNGLWNSFEKLNLDCATGRLMKEPTRWQCPNSFPSTGKDKGRGEADQLISKGSEPVKVILSVSGLESYVLALHITEFTELLPEYLTSKN
jgi:hypothetical protein